MNDMPGNGNHREEGNWSQGRPHEEFLELCAVSTTGELSEEEQKKLREHLAICPECRQALAEFEAVADVGAPLLASELAALGAEEEGAIAETPSAVRAQRDRIESSASQAARAERGVVSVLGRQNGHRRTEVNWNYVWMPFAAAVLLTVSLGIYSYELGKRHSPQLAQTKSTLNDGKLDALEQQLSDAGHARELLTAQLTERDRMIRELRHQIETESSALNDARNAQANLERSLQDAVSQQQQMAQQQSSADQNLVSAQDSLRKVQVELDSAKEQRDQDEANAGSLEAQIRDLNAQLRQSEQTIGKQQDLLADDRDIRNLMGARDLYIAEVYDVGRDGTTQKPYGRVFYTKGKSLVFYAYDLDQQPGSRDTSTFQAWGQNGPDRQEALNLGVFYQDSVSKKRWVLRFDDPRALEQINAVFVTVEPKGGSHKPSGRPLLFASLKIEPNHP
jgi:hypothetical protein